VPFTSGKNAAATSSKQSSQTRKTIVHRPKATLGRSDIAASTLTLFPEKSAPLLDKIAFYHDERVRQSLDKHGELPILLFGLFEKSAVESLAEIIAQAQDNHF
jgi:hypothetical protein